jgi:hypothetical protein
MAEPGARSTVDRNNGSEIQCHAAYWCGSSRICNAVARRCRTGAGRGAGAGPRVRRRGLVQEGQAQVAVTARRGRAQTWAGEGAVIRFLPLGCGDCASRGARVHCMRGRVKARRASAGVCDFSHADERFSLVFFSCRDIDGGIGFFFISTYPCRGLICVQPDGDEEVRKVPGDNIRDHRRWSAKEALGAEMVQQIDPDSTC